MASLAAAASSSATAPTEDLSPEELKHKQRYDQLKEQAKDVEKSNTELVLKLRKAKHTIERLKTERKVLYDYLLKLTGQTVELADEEADLKTETRLKQAVERKPSLKLAAAKKGSTATTTAAANGTATAKSVAAAASTAPQTAGKKRKRTTAPKDKDAPKKPGNAFLVYCQVVKEQFAAENPDVSWADLVKQLGAKWKSLPAEERKIYYDMFEEQKARYEVEKREYDSKKLAESGGVGDMQIAALSSSPRLPSSQQQPQQYGVAAKKKQPSQLQIHPQPDAMDILAGDGDEDDISDEEEEDENESLQRAPSASISLESEDGIDDILGEDDFDLDDLDGSQVI